MNEKTGVVRDLRIVEYDNRPIARARYEFDYEPFASRGLTRLRTRYHLDKVIGRSKGDFKQILRMRDWVSSRFDHGFCNLEKWETNALAYLRRAEEGECFTCAVFAFVLVEALTAVGIPARNLTIAQADTDFVGEDTRNIGHCVAEAWSNEFRKWIVLDPDQAAHYERDGAPLNALEIRQAWLNGAWKKVRFAQGRHVPRILPRGYPGPVEQLYRTPNPYHVHNSMDYYHNVEFHMGNRHYTKGGNPPRRLVWTDEHRLPQLVRQNVAVDPGVRIITPLRSDIYYTLNQAFINLHCRRRGDGKPVPVLNVNLDTETPWFDYVQVRIGKGKWQKKPERFTWRLHNGLNVIQARPVNKFGREGIVSRVVVRCKMSV